LNEVAAMVEKKMEKILKGRSVGLRWVLFGKFENYIDNMYFEVHMDGSLLQRVQ
jgi:hypothetical protein